MKDTKKLYELIMSSVAKEVKKAINEGEEYEDEEIDIQGDTEAWIDAIKHYLDVNTDSDKTLSLYVTLLPAYVNNDKTYEYDPSYLAELLMNTVKKDGGYNVPPVDEVFIEPIASEIMHSSLVHEFIEKVTMLHTLDIDGF